uniref:Death domain-containing protein n=1 Tax=Amphimedon queenslandica TaxID=400682 RepID=A0A1X7SWC8_AMPQE
MATSPSSSLFINVCNKELSKKDFYAVYNRIKPLSAGWKQIAISWRLELDTINRIEADCRGDTIACLQKVIEYWLKKDYDYKSHGIPCWRRVCVAVKEGGGDPALADEIAREHPLPATVGVPINIIHSEGMSPGSTGIFTKLGMIVSIFIGGCNSNDNDTLLSLPSADRRDISPFDAAMSPGSGKSNSSTCKQYGILWRIINFANS